MTMHVSICLKALITPVRVFCVLCLLPAVAFAEGAHSPENPTIVLGLLGGVGLAWQYYRSRGAR